MDLRERIKLLIDGGVIETGIGDKMLELIGYFEINYDRLINDEQLAMFITHLAMSLQRIVKREVVEQSIDDSLYQEVLDSPVFGRANGILAQLEHTSGCQLPECEKRFVLLHLCSLLQKESVQ